MKARILFMVVVFLLPSPDMAQNLDYLSNHFSNNFQKNNLCIRNNFSTDDERSLFLIRITGMDKENNINFYGFDLSWVHANEYANFWGLSFNAGLGNPPIQGKATNNISFNGVNFSLIITGITGTINGFSFGGLWGNSAKSVNGIACGILGTDSEYLNGLATGGLMSFSQYANAIQIACILNGYCNFNGIGIALINTTFSGFEELMKSRTNNYCNENIMYGVIFGLYNAVDVKGLSLALVNNGNSWLEIGLFNMGNSIVQIGLVNLDGNYKMGIPIININF